MKYKFALRVSMITLIGSSLVACGASLEEYQKFAAAGKDYATAIDTLLVASGNYFVYANSEDLISNRLPKKPEANAMFYSKITENDDKWLVLIARMRRHTDLLKRYFMALENLATSDDPAEAQKATENIFNQLNKVSTEIQGSPLISTQIGAALSPIPKIILTEKIKGALRDELEKRKEAIYREIAIQNLVLELLKIQLKSDLKTIQNDQDNRLLLPPYTATTPIQNPDEWIAKRREVRTMTLSIEALNNATQASQSFQEDFQLLLEDKFTTGRANALLSDIESLLNVAEDLKKVTNKPKEN